jgi:hypothetical protein
MMLPQDGMVGGVPAPMNDSTRLGDDRRGADIGRLHDQRGKRVGQDVAEQDRRQARAGRHRRLDEGLLAQGQHDAAHEAGDAGKSRRR